MLICFTLILLDVFPGFKIYSNIQNIQSLLLLRMRYIFTYNFYQELLHIISFLKTIQNLVIVLNLVVLTFCVHIFYRWIIYSPESFISFVFPFHSTLHWIGTPEKVGENK